MIFDIDEKDEILKLKEKYNKVEEILNIRSDNREKLRIMSNEVMLNFETLDDCIDSYEFSLLISCYTISEQLLKKFIYHILEKDGNSNEYIDLFINTKINPESFSPNVLITRITKQISVFCNTYKLLINENHEDFKIYNSMIKARHQYAHANNYPFEFHNYATCIKVIEYLSFEYSFFIHNKKLRLIIQNEFSNIKDNMEYIIKLNNFDFRNPKIKKHRDSCKIFINKYEKHLQGVPLIDDLLTDISNFSNIDLRNKDQEEYIFLSNKIYKKMKN